MLEGCGWWVELVHMRIKLANTPGLGIVQAGTLWFNRLPSWHCSVEEININVNFHKKKSPPNLNVCSHKTIQSVCQVTQASSMSMWQATCFEKGTIILEVDQMLTKQNNDNSKNIKDGLNADLGAKSGNTLRLPMDLSEKGGGTDWCCWEHTRGFCCCNCALLLLPFSLMSRQAHPMLWLFFSHFVHCNHTNSASVPRTHGFWGCGILGLKNGKSLQQISSCLSFKPRFFSEGVSAWN